MGTLMEGFIQGTRRRHSEKEASHAARADTAPRPKDDRGRADGRPAMYG